MRVERRAMSIANFIKRLLSYSKKPKLIELESEVLMTCLDEETGIVVTVDITSPPDTWPREEVPKSVTIDGKQFKILKYELTLRGKDLPPGCDEFGISEIINNDGEINVHFKR